MRSSNLSALLCLAATAQAVNILAFPRRTCLRDNSLGICRDILPSTCCVFPTFGLTAQAAYFSILHSCTIGLWYYEEPNTGEPLRCAINRDTAAGPQSDVCLTAGTFAPGGGAAWFDLSLCRSLAAEGNATAAGDYLKAVEAFEPAKLAAEVGPCQGEQYATLYGYTDDGGVYALDPTPEQFVKLDAMGPTEDNKVHVERLKSVGATYYADIARAPGMKEVLAARAAM